MNVLEFILMILLAAFLVIFWLCCVWREPGRDDKDGE